MIQDIILDTLTDGIRLLPFLFVTYLIMEYIEHKTSDKARQIMQKSGKWGPVFGGLLGMFPQCGFSTAASNLYAGGIITIGTLSAVFLSTSDEMLPIFISEQVPFITIVKILTVKVIIGIMAGFLMDLVIRHKKGDGKEKMRIDRLCDHHHCRCQEGNILKSALSHTLQIFLFVILITFFINLVIGWAGEERLAALISGNLFSGPALSGLVGLIPNCAASVVLTQLYLEGVLGAGSMLAGLLSGSGVGLLVLYKVNDNLKENIKITLLLYAAGVFSGILIEITGLIF